MTRIAYRIVDVFSDRPLAGNALCVVLDPVAPAQRAALAREVNLSETTFPAVTRRPAGPVEGRYDVHIHTPVAELPFAGHPTLGTAWVLGPGRWEQTSPGATVVVRAEAGRASMVQPVPVCTPTAAAPAVAALGLPGAEGAWVAEAGGVRHLVVLTDAALEHLEPDLGAVRRLAGAVDVTTTAVVRRRHDRELHVRVFVPGHGVPEDPGTGSAAGPIATLAHREWGTATDVTIRQGGEIGRPCLIEVTVAADGPVVGGAVVGCAEGHFDLG